MYKRLAKLLLLLVLSPLGIVLATPTAHAEITTLSECYQSKGLALPSIATRAIEAAKIGIWQYRGTAEQNTALKDFICPPSDKLGFSVATDYQKTLAAPMTSTQATITVSSLTLKDGTTLDMTMLGSKVFLTLEPGGSKEEIVMCTGITTSTKTFTGCTRGLAFSGTATTAVTANQKTHNSGSIIVMSNVHYVYEQYADVNSKDQTLYGIKTFVEFPLYAVPTTLPTSTGQLATKYYVDNVGAGGFTASNVSTTRGLSVDGSAPERVGVNASTTKGLAFDSDGALYLNASSTSMSFDDSGSLYFDTSKDLILSGNVTSSASLRVPYPTIDEDAVTKSYTDRATFLNSATGTADNTITAGQALYATASSTIAATTSNTTSTYRFVGIAEEAAAPAATVRYSKVGGINCEQSGLTPGQYYYLNGTSGEINTTPGNNIARIGLALSATCLEVTHPTFFKTEFISTTTAGTIHVNTGFYPAKVTLTAGVTDGMSVGDDTNTCAYVVDVGSGATIGFEGTQAWNVQNSSGNYYGQILNKTAEGFDISVTISAGTPTLYFTYTAYSE